MSFAAVHGAAPGSLCHRPWAWLPARWAGGLGVGLVLAFGPGTAGPTARACSVPVFRYALDRWPADRFRFDVPAEGLRAEPLATVFHNLGTASPLNLETKAVAGGDARLWFPTRERQPETVVWEGALTPEVFQALRDSPARGELARRILAGASGVWVIVQGGKADANEALERLVAGRVKFLNAAIGLPPVDPEDPASKLGPGPELKVDVSVQVVAGAGSAEAFFSRLLRGPSGLGAGAADEPFAALVFGRGRVLGAWPASRVTEDLVVEATRFLLGSCSCEVKQQNPGWDLLMDVDWDGALAEAGRQRSARVGEARGAAVAGASKTEASTLVPDTVTIAPRADSRIEPADERLAGGRGRSRRGAVLVVGLAVTYALVRRGMRVFFSRP